VDSQANGVVHTQASACYFSARATSASCSNTPTRRHADTHTHTHTHTHTPACVRASAHQADASSMYQRVVWYFSLPFFYLVIPFVFISLFVADKRAVLADMGARWDSPPPPTCVRASARQADASSMSPRVVWYFSLAIFYLVIPFVFISLWVADKRAVLADMGARWDSHKTHGP
jgi:hypothetical protein